MESSYEKFRTVLLMNLCSAVSADQINDVMKAIDITMGDFEISPKQMAIITADGTPDVVKYYIGAKAIAGRSVKTLAQYRYKLVDFFDTIRKSFADVTPNDIRMYLYTYKVEHNASDRYLENIRTTLNGFFKWLAQRDFMMKNPAKTSTQLSIKRRSANLSRLMILRCSVGTQKISARRR